MSMSLHWFGVSRLHTELLGWAAKLTPLVQDRPDLRAAVDSSIAYRYVIAEQLDLARQRARSALADAADDQTRCRALEALGDSCIFQGDLDQAHSWWSELVKVGRRSGETYYELIGHVGAVMSLAYGGQADAARRYLAEVDGWFAQRHVEPYASGVGWPICTAKCCSTPTRQPRWRSSAGPSGWRTRRAATMWAASRGCRRSRCSRARHRLVAALPLYADVIERWLDVGSWSHLLTTMRNLVPTLTEVGCRLRGSTGTRGSCPAGPYPELRPRTRKALGGRVCAAEPVRCCRVRAATRCGQHA